MSSTQFSIQSSDPALFEKAVRIADEFARPYRRAESVGIVYLGALARGYFDAYADIDIIVFTTPEARVTAPGNYVHVQGLEVHYDLLDYAAECAAPWNMAKRWAFAQANIVYDPQGRVRQLLQDKIPLQPEEKRWLLIEGMTQSEWYANTLTEAWVARGNLVSAHHMFAEGLTHFFNALFALNNQLVADVKWRYYCVEQLAWLPSDFREHIRAVFLTTAISAEEIARRRRAFMDIWREILPHVEREVHMSFETFSKLV